MDFIFKYDKSDCNEDYYQVLGCDENSSKEQIMAEYKSRALVVHPDKHHNNTEAEELFKKLVKAKDVLTDPEMRRSYDKWRNSGIAITFDKWIRLGKGVHISMHWRNKCHKELMLENGQQSQSQPPFELMSKPLKTFWRSDSNNEMINKFRNYEI